MMDLVARDLKPGDQVIGPDGKADYEVRAAELSQGHVQVTDIDGHTRTLYETDTVRVRRPPLPGAAP